ncbi:MAG TPA: HisA/HisF-related TIM barrel protein [Candidatus Baltobacteraceae bacterium]|nr:HisA/HisF-related TIM barrel protein [Candidatus Baltobacteraceae bacterium]
MIVIPALDLRGGKCVRMEQGDLKTSTVYAEDPVAKAKAFVAEGAKRLHVIDLDAAFKHGDNLPIIRDICRAVDIPVQVGGGIRNAEQAQARVDAGAAEIILGTLLVEDERIARNIIGKFGERVIAGIDARGTHVATHGWQESAPVDRDSLVKRVALWGVKRVIFTEIRRDGMGEGYDIEALRAVAAAAEVHVTANGGARTIDDLMLLKREAPPTVDMCIVASAVYKGTIKLADAIKALA